MGRNGRSLSGKVADEEIQKQSQKNKITRNAFEFVNKKFNVMKSKGLIEKLYRNNM